MLHPPRPWEQPASLHGPVQPQSSAHVIDHSTHSTLPHGTQPSLPNGAAVEARTRGLYRVSGTPPMLPIADMRSRRWCPPAWHAATGAMSSRRWRFSKITNSIQPHAWSSCAVHSQNGTSRAACIHVYVAAPLTSLYVAGQPGHVPQIDEITTGRQGRRPLQHPCLAQPGGRAQGWAATVTVHWVLKLQLDQAQQLRKPRQLLEVCRVLGLGTAGVVDMGCLPPTSLAR